MTTPATTTAAPSSARARGPVLAAFGSSAVFGTIAGFTFSSVSPPTLVMYDLNNFVNNISSNLEKDLSAKLCDEIKLVCYKYNEIQATRHYIKSLKKIDPDGVTEASKKRKLTEAYTTTQ